MVKLPRWFVAIFFAFSALLFAADELAERLQPALEAITPDSWFWGTVIVEQDDARLNCVDLWVENWIAATLVSTSSSAWTPTTEPAERCWPTRNCGGSTPPTTAEPT